MTAGTVLFAAGQKYAVDCGPEKALRLSAQNDILKLTNGNDAIWLKSTSVTHAAVLNMPRDHGHIFTLTAAPKRRGDDKTDA